MLGLNPLEQEVLDLTNEVARNGLIYFPEFCQIVTKKYREEDQEVFRQNMFKVQTFYHLFYLSVYEDTCHTSVKYHPSSMKIFSHFLFIIMLVLIFS